jgi:quercetin dioxygenase-like cupin family protein
MEAQAKSLSEMRPQELPWGSITWLVSGAIGNSETMTFGRVVIRKGKGNEEHRHDNCDEILHLLDGELEHTAGRDKVFRLRPGDTITLPAGTRHSARSVGERDAVMLVAYSTAHRQVRGE